MFGLLSQKQFILGLLKPFSFNCNKAEIARIEVQRFLSFINLAALHRPTTLLPCRYKSTNSEVDRQNLKVKLNKKQSHTNESESYVKYLREDEKFRINNKREKSQSQTSIQSRNKQSESKKSNRDENLLIHPTDNDLDLENLSKSPTCRSVPIESWMQNFLQTLADDPTRVMDWAEVEKYFLRFSKWQTVLLLLMSMKEEFVPGLLENGLSLVRFIGSADKRLDLIQRACSISLYINQGKPEDHKLAFECYDEFCAITDVYDSSIALLLIKAFSKTQRWKESLGFIEIAKLSLPNLSSQYYTHVIVAALKADEMGIADELFKQLSLTIANDGSNDYIDSLLCAMVDMGLASKVLKVLEEFGWIISESAALKLKKYFLSLGQSEPWKVENAIVMQSVCSSCQSELLPLPTVTDEEFDRLRNSFVRNSVTRKGNVFINTTPNELTKFQTFLETSPQFDVIIDGLNVSNCIGRRNYDQAERDYVLSQVIKYFARKSNVLVLGRKHMQHMESLKLARPYINVDWFLTENTSRDDPFLVYAALYNGQKTMIVTKDQLRDHRFLLGTELATMLKTWQRGHQIMFIGISQTRPQKLQFKWPDVHDTITQHNLDNWHIPFDNGTQMTSFQKPNNWLCLKRHSK